MDEKTERKAFRQPGDRAMYTVPVRDTENGMDGWTDMPEADPRAQCRAKVDFHEGNLLVRIDSAGLMHPNRPDDIEILRSEDEE